MRIEETLINANALKNRQPDCEKKIYFADLNWKPGKKEGEQKVKEFFARGDFFFAGNKGAASIFLTFVMRNEK